MSSWTGSSRASPNNLADVITSGGVTTAIVACGPLASSIRQVSQRGTLRADFEATEAGEFVVIERGAVHAFVRTSPAGVVLFRGEDGYVDTFAGAKRMYPLEAIESAVLLVGVPKDRINRHQLERWLERGAPQASLDKLVKAWGDHAVVVIESWRPPLQGSGLEIDRSAFQVGMDPSLFISAAPFDGPRPETDPDAETPVVGRTRDSIPPQRGASFGTIPPPALWTASPASDELRDIVQEIQQEITPPEPTHSEPASTHPKQDRRLIAAIGGAAVVLAFFLVAIVAFLLLR